MAITNQVSTIYRIIGGGKVEKTNKKIAMSMNMVNRAGKRLQRGLMNTGRLFGAQAMGLITIGYTIRKVVRSYAEYEDSLARIRTTLAATNGNFHDNARAASAVSEMMSRRLAYSTTEANDAMSTLLQTGISTHEAIQIYETGLKLARVAGMDTNTAMQFMVDSSNAFNQEMLDNKESTRQFARRMTSQLSVAANSAATSITQLQHAFRYAGGEMAGFGYGSQETIAALASMSAGGIRGGNAGTRLRGAIAALQQPTQKAIDVFKQFGVTEDELKQTFYTAEGARRPLAEGMSRLGDIFKRVNTDTGRNQALLRLFGRRALIAGMSLSNMGKIAETFQTIWGNFEGAEGFEQIARDIRSGAVIDRQAEARMQSFGIQVEQTKHATEDLAIAFGETLFSGMKTGDEGFGTYLRNLVGHARLAKLGNQRTTEQTIEWNRLSDAQKLSATNLQEFLTSAAELIIGLGKIIKFTAKAIQKLGDMGFTVTSVIGALLTMKVGFGLLRFTLNNTGLVARLFTGNITGVGTAMTGASRAAGIMNSALIGGAVIIGGAVVNNVLKATIAATGFAKEMKLIEENTVAGYAAVAETIPVIGELIAAALRVTGLFQYAIQLRDKLLQTRESRQSRVGASAETMMERERTRRQGRGEAFTDEDRASFARRQSMSAVGRLSAAYARIYKTWVLQHGKEEASRRIQSGVGSLLTRQGVGRLQSEQIAQQVLRDLGTRGQLEVSLREAQTLGYTAANSVQTMRNIATQIGDFSRIIGGVQSGPTPNMESTIMGQSVMPLMGGFDNTSTFTPNIRQARIPDPSSIHGDSLSFLSGGGEGGTIQPPGGGSRSETYNVEVPVSLQLDSEQIARGVANVQIRHNERSGMTIQPGQRRTSSESGFSESRR